MHEEDFAVFIGSIFASQKSRRIEYIHTKHPVNPDCCVKKFSVRWCGYVHAAIAVLRKAKHSTIFLWFDICQSWSKYLRTQDLLFLGRARRSRDGLMESRLHRHRCHAGHRTPGWSLGGQPRGGGSAVCGGSRITLSRDSVMWYDGRGRSAFMLSQRILVLWIHCVCVQIDSLLQKSNDFWPTGRLTQHCFARKKNFNEETWAIWLVFLLEWCAGLLTSSFELLVGWN